MQSQFRVPCRQSAIIPRNASVYGHWTRIYEYDMVSHLDKARACIASNELCVASVENVAVVHHIYSVA